MNSFFLFSIIIFYNTHNITNVFYIYRVHCALDILRLDYQNYFFAKILEYRIKMIN